MMRDGSRKYCDVAVGIGGVFGADLIACGGLVSIRWF